MSEQKFFICRKCKNMVGLIKDGGMPIECCGEAMELLVANTTDAATEKHIPDISVKERLVHVIIGSVPHPMTDEHHIEFIYLQTANGGQMKRINVESQASVMFAVLNDEPVAAFAYCNLHGLWKSEVAFEVTQTCLDTEDDDAQDEKTCCVQPEHDCKA